jgi:hypothetical protein
VTTSYLMQARWMRPAGPGVERNGPDTSGKSIHTLGNMVPANFHRDGAALLDASLVPGGAKPLLIRMGSVTMPCRRRQRDTRDRRVTKGVTSRLSNDRDSSHLDLKNSFRVSILGLLVLAAEDPPSP